MFLTLIKNFIKNNPEVYAVTSRGLETIMGTVVFKAKDLDTRYPELKEFLNPKSEPVVSEKVSENPKKKSKK